MADSEETQQLEITQEATEDAPAENAPEGAEGEPDNDAPPPAEDGEQQEEVVAQEVPPAEEGQQDMEGGQQEKEESPPQTGEEPPAEGQEPAEPAAEGEGEQTAAEGGETAEVGPTEGGEPQAEGEAAPGEGEGEAVQGEGEEPTPAVDGAEEEAPAEAAEGQAAEGQTAEGPAPEGQAPEGEEGEATQEEQPAEEGEQREGEGEPKPEAEGEEGEQVAQEEQTPAEGEAAPEGEDQAQVASTDVAGDTILEEEEPEEEPVPQSDSFTAGEMPESPVAVGEKLSREGSPEQLQDTGVDEMPPTLEPGTPERYDSDDEGEGKAVRVEEIIEEEEEDEMEPEFDRDLLIEKYHAAIAEREQLQQQNYQLQHKLADYFRKKKSDDTRQEVDKNVTDQEQRYLKYMSNLEDLRRQDSELRDDYKRQIEELKDRCMDRKDMVDYESDRFIQMKRHVATASINSRSGKPIPPKDIETYLVNEMKKEADVVSVRLENIKLKNKLKKKELQLKSKEELAEGLHLIDFEQLKIENQTYNEKIEERNEELLKLRRKITGTVQVLTHLKEKLQFVQGENGVQKAKLRDVEELVAKKRDVLSRTKQARDALRIDNQRLRQNCGLLGNEPLLRDFEERKDEGDDLRTKLDELKMFHAELTLNCTGVRRKIDQARAETA